MEILQNLVKMQTLLVESMQIGLLKIRHGWRKLKISGVQAPGRVQSDGNSVFVLGKDFGNVFVGLQPSFGYEGDPMRLLFEKGFAPTHAFSTFYQWLKNEYEGRCSSAFWYAWCT
jgi:cobalamin biosynthesis Mg chelatase CobN